MNAPVGPFARLCFAMSLLGSTLLCKAEPIPFPDGYVPFASLYYVTSPNAGGYSLVAGTVESTTALAELLNYLHSLPSVTGNQAYGNDLIELAPGQFFRNVLVPTDAERMGDFRDYGIVYDPYTGPLRFSEGNPFPLPVNVSSGQYSPFPGNIIPASRLGLFFAFRQGPADTPASLAPEPADAMLLISGALFLLLGKIGTHSSPVRG